MTGDKILRFENAVPESAIEAIAKQVLGVRLHQWSKAESGRMCSNFERQRQQLDSAVTDIQERLNALALGDYEVPTDSEGKETMSREDYAFMQRQTLNSMMAQNIASLEKLTGIYLKLTAGGLGAMLAGMKQSAELAKQNSSDNQERDATPRRRFGSGLSQVIDA